MPQNKTHLEIKTLWDSGSHSPKDIGKVIRTPKGCWKAFYTEEVDQI